MDAKRERTPPEPVSLRVKNREPRLYALVNLGDGVAGYIRALSPGERAAADYSLVARLEKVLPGAEESAPMSEEDSG